MSEARGVVVAHGTLALCLVETVESISGVEGALWPISNEGCSPELLMDRIRDAVDGERTIVFVDLASGSCAHSARLVGRESSRVPVVSGVNLPMLLDFVFHRDMDVRELSRRVAEKGRVGTMVHLPDDSL